MFCDRCGTSVANDQRFCGRCGREFVGGGGPVLAFPRRNRVAEHIRMVGILWLALSALNAVGGLLLFIVANTVILHLPEMGAPSETTAWLHPLVTLIAVLVLAKGLIGFLAGWGLLQRESWARMLTLVLAFLALFNIPFGTALGIYTLWVLLPAGSDAEYQAEVFSAKAA
jgi:hypothetical protein